MQCEINSLCQQNVFLPADLPPGRKAIGVQWVYAYKFNPDGFIICGMEKARLVAQGFSQRLEDYGTTYAPVTKMMSIQIILAYAALHDLDLFTFDVKTAFLNAPLSHEIYCKQIPGFPNPDPKRVNHVLRALYGLKQASYKWYEVIKEELKSYGLTCCEVD